MRFESFSFGSIQIDGVTYEHDLIIDRGEIGKRKKLGGPDLKHDVTIGGRGSKGTALRLTVMPTRSRQSCACIPSSSLLRRSTSTK